MRDPIEIKLLPDGTEEVRTTGSDPYLQERRAADEARLREAVEQMRQQGIPRPVALLVQEGVTVAVPQGAIPVRIEGEPGWRAHVTTPVQARLLLKPFYRKASDFFRVPMWPVSYCTAQFYAGGWAEAYESCFWADDSANEESP